MIWARGYSTKGDVGDMSIAVACIILVEGGQPTSLMMMGMLVI